MGVDFGHFRGPRGPKLRNYLKKKVKALLQIKINCIKVVLINHIYIIQL